jgi:hypothetical protein
MMVGGDDASCPSVNIAQTMTLHRLANRLFGVVVATFEHHLQGNESDLIATAGCVEMTLHCGQRREPMEVTPGAPGLEMVGRDNQRVNGG